MTAHCSDLQYVVVAYKVMCTHFVAIYDISTKTPIATIIQEEIQTKSVSLLGKTLLIANTKGGLAVHEIGLQARTILTHQFEIPATIILMVNANKFV